MQPSGSVSRECPDCRGLGWLTTDLTPGQSTAQLVRCVCNPVRVDAARLQALSVAALEQLAVAQLAFGSLADLELWLAKRA